MKCLSVRQPWAWLIVNGIKDVENRTWRTKYRGTLLIHASKTLDEDCGPVNGVIFPPSYPLGAIVGRVNLISWSIFKPGRSSVWHRIDAIGWYLDNAQEFVTPIPYRGWPGLFEVPDELVENAAIVGTPEVGG